MKNSEDRHWSGIEELISIQNNISSCLAHDATQTISDGFSATYPPAPSLVSYANKFSSTSSKRGWAGSVKPYHISHMGSLWDMVDDPSLKSLVVMTGTQLGKTTLIQIFICYALQYLRAKVLVVLPDDRRKGAFAKDIEEYIRKNALELSRMMPDSMDKKSSNIKISANRVQSKREDRKFTNGARLLCEHATSRTAVEGYTVDFVIYDECDSVHAGRVGVFARGDARIEHSQFGKVMFFAAPQKIQSDSNIYNLYSQAPFVKDAALKCHSCGELQLPSHDRVKGAVKHTENGQMVADFEERDAYYECVNVYCKDREWTQKQFDSAKGEGAFMIRGDTSSKEQAVWISGFMSKDLNFLFKRKVEANNAVRQNMDYTKWFSFTNSILGYPAHREGMLVSKKEAYNATVTEEFSLEAVHDDTCFMVVSADIGSENVFALTTSYHYNAKHNKMVACVLDYTVLNGDTSESEVWRKFTKYTSTMKARTKTLRTVIRPYGVIIDCGYRKDPVFRELSHLLKVDSQRLLIAYKGNANGEFNLNLLGKKDAREIKFFTRADGVVTFRPTSMGSNVGKSNVMKLLSDSVISSKENLGRSLLVSKAKWNARFVDELTAEIGTPARFNGKAFTKWEKIKGARKNEGLDVLAMSYSLLEIHSARVGKTINEFLINETWLIRRESVANQLLLESKEDTNE